MKKIILIVLIFNFMVCVIMAGSYKYVEKIDNNEKILYKNSGIELTFNSVIDWGNYEIKVNVEEEKEIKDSRELVERYNVLKVEAINRAALILDDIKIDSNYKIGDYKNLNQNFSVKLKAFISEVDIKERSYKNGIISCTVVIPIAGEDESISSFIIDDYYSYKIGFRMNLFDLFSNKIYAAENTGIIIDARKAGINPAILPKVVTKAGTVYNPKDVSKTELKKSGAVQYIIAGDKVDDKQILKESLTGKEEFQRTGTNPLIVKSYSTKGKLKTDAVVSKEDAEKMKKSGNLKNGKVTIIVDAKVGGVIGIKNIGDYDIILLARE